MTNGIDNDFTPDELAEHETFIREEHERWAWLCGQADGDTDKVADDRTVREFVLIALKAGEHADDDDRFTAATFLLAADVPGQYRNSDRLAAEWHRVRYTIAELLLALHEAALGGDDGQEPSYRAVRRVEAAHEGIGIAIERWKMNLSGEAR